MHQNVSVENSAQKAPSHTHRKGNVVSIAYTTRVVKYYLQKRALKLAQANKGKIGYCSDLMYPRYSVGNVVCLHAVSPAISKTRASKVRSVERLSLQISAVQIECEP